MTSEEEISVPRRTEEYERSIFEQEFTEEDVLPFLLQAQDIISKLESRVVELEKDLSSIHCKYEHDKNEWLIGLSQKDQYINHLSSKLSKIEFNSKETIVLLSDLNTNDEQIKSVTHLCLQYLRQAQTIKEDDLEEGEIERRQAAVAEWSQQHITDNPPTHPEEPVNLMDGLSSSSGSSHVVYPKPSLYIQTEEEEKNGQCCMNCKQLLAQLDEQIEQKAYLKRDLGSLAAALSEQEEIRSTIEQDKEALELDVGDITSTLFSNLNQILMDDVTGRDGIVQLNREMNGQLVGMLDSWDTREFRLKEMKEALVQLDSAVHQSANTSSTFIHRFSSPPQQTSPISTTTTNTIPRRLISHRHSSSYQNNNGTIQIDGYILSEFQHHLKIVTEGKTTQPTIPPTAFVKRVFSEDIEPCLFSQQSQGWWKSTWFKKKLLEAISKNKCEIQYWNGTYHTSYMSTTTNSSSCSVASATSHLSVSSSNGPSPPKTKCVCCNLLRVCEFRMKLPPTSNPWLPIDRFCRDRVIAVCGYYSFMNNLKMLSSSTTLLNAFKQVMFHRRRMTLSRVGSISLFEDLDELLDDRRQSSYRKSQHRSSNRESLVLDHSGSNSDTGSIVSVSDLQGLEGTTANQIVIVN
ncbi:hypothetical protein G6F56_006124 [Rhizopus delemar]|uniref:GDP/GTP exchange factor Sec2 N-terminal domain-containing protein n=1 Tax=Rhizopus stolonifer TaxID=4846 RepID=A0A367KYS8_RHIST|nr:hypothetical protein G6F56_006124 [Rhizopus delemar]RCI07297.1 hypothetical protein CU098_003347 [Rhizopus stolonifer]